jgi:CHAT domain-containing protein/uncharacterized protein HemY
MLRLALVTVTVIIIAQRCHHAAHSQTAALKVGVAAKGEISGGQTQAHSLSLLAIQFVRVEVDHYGFDAAIAVVAPDGQTVNQAEATSDAAYGTGFGFITAQAGTYQLTVKSEGKETTAKPYTALVSEARPVESLDEAKLAAERRIHAANKERSARTAEARRAALKGYGEALNSSRQINDRRGEANALHEMARTYNDLGERELARDYHQQALAARRAINHQQGIASSLHNLGNVAGNLGDAATAQQHLEEALAIRRSLGDKRGELMTLNGLGQLWANRGDFKQATPYYEQVQRLAHEAGDRRSEAEALFGLGRFARQQGQPQKAMDAFNAALALYTAIGNRQGEAGTLQAMGVAYLVSNEREKAIDFLTRALAAARDIKNKGLEANILNPLADAYAGAGNTAKAMETYEEALQATREINNPRVEASILSNQASLHASLGEQQKALALYQRALALAQKFGGPRGDAPQLQGVAETYNALGEKQQALDHYQLALATARKLNDPVFEASILSNIGRTLNSLGDRQRALDRLQEALAIAQRLKMPGLEANILLDQGWMFYSAGEASEALQQFDAVLARAGIAPGTQIAALNGAALCHNELDRHAQSQELLQRALELARKIGSRAGEASALLNLGTVAAKQAKPEAAREHLAAALTAKRAVSDRSGEAAVLYALAKLDRDAGALDSARTQIESALDLIETLRSKVASQDLRTSFFAAVRRYYDLYLHVLMELDKQRPGEDFSAQALQASERARARSLLDLLAESRADIRQGVNPALVERERELQDLLNGKADALLQARQRRGSEPQVAVLTKDIDQLTGELQQLRTTIRQQSPRYAELTQPQPLSVKELQARVLDENTLLLEYALGETRSYLWAVSKTSLRSYVLPNRAEIETAAQELYGLLTVRNQSQRKLAGAQGQIVNVTNPAQADAQYWRAARKLSEMILQPVAAQLGNKRLVIVAEGALQYVPFGALPVVGRRSPVAGRKTVINRQPTTDHRQPLIVNHEIINLPSASTLAVLRNEVKDRSAAPRMLAVFADPVFDERDERLKAEAAKAKPEKGEMADTTRKLIVSKLGDAEDGFRIQRLKFTRHEAERIAQAATVDDTRIALDFAARRAALFDKELSQYRIVHIATHGLLDAERPELSALIFSLVDEQGKTQDGFLRAHEIYNLNLPAELVVLSACETGLGKQIKGEGLVGLTRGFMYAGAPRVVVSLWSVSDKATSELMARFYRKLLKENVRPAAALRAAQIEMWQATRWRAPYYWSAFTLQGEWQ